MTRARRWVRTRRDQVRRANAPALRKHASRRTRPCLAIAACDSHRRRQRFAAYLERNASAPTLLSSDSKCAESEARTSSSSERVAASSRSSAAARSDIWPALRRRTSSDLARSSSLAVDSFNRSARSRSSDSASDSASSRCSRSSFTTRAIAPECALSARSRSRSARSVACSASSHRRRSSSLMDSISVSEPSCDSSASRNASTSRESISYTLPEGLGLGLGLGGPARGRTGGVVLDPRAGDADRDRRGCARVDVAAAPARADAALFARASSPAVPGPCPHGILGRRVVVVVVGGPVGAPVGRSVSGSLEPPSGTADAFPARSRRTSKPRAQS
mmetsp:Transcript_10541/g.47458  ORF Transcript_10541/g.47458 Transcript_10541/m.47458 type:complete len:333 (+) Transcript_10541:2474-3472(+)